MTIAPETSTVRSSETEVDQPVEHADHGADHHHGPTGFLKWISSTDHKVIGTSYIVTSIIFLVLGGIMAVFIRIQLAAPGSHVFTEQQFNELFTMHGSFMIYLFAGPFAFGGVANYFVPIQIGAPDMAFPRLNALSYWLYLGGALLMTFGFVVEGGAADFGWVAYAPLSNAVNSPGSGADLWIMALVLTGFSAIFTGVNLVTTIFCLRAPGMTMFRMPIFTWNMLVTGILILIAFPVLTAALVMLWADRHLGTHIYSTAGGGSPVLWQHLFWFWGHPEVYILALPFFGIVTEIIPVFSRKPLFGYRGMVFATISIAALSTGVWAHHMFTTGSVLLPFFSGMSYLIAVPTGIKFFNWIGTMWKGQITFTVPMLFAIGFLITFLIGGLTGMFLASPPIDFSTHDTYYVVAHFHSVVMALVLGGIGAIYFWFPKMAGFRLNERIGKINFWLLFIGSNVLVGPMYVVGLRGMPRRIAQYPADAGWTWLNKFETIGGVIIAASFLFFVHNVFYSWKKRERVGDDPWGYGQSLEWATSSPPPSHNFETIPRIRSFRPAWDMHHPDHPALEEHSA